MTNIFGKCKACGNDATQNCSYCGVMICQDCCIGYGCKLCGGKKR